MKSSQTKDSLAVLGAGSWGTALAILLAHNGVSVRLWGRDSVAMAEMITAGHNTRFLANFSFPTHLQACSHIEQALEGISDVLIAVPSAGFRTTLQLLARQTRRPLRLAWASKGLESPTGKLLHQVAGEVLPDSPLAVISGPTFAQEVAAQLPTAITLASNDAVFAHDLGAQLHNERFRVYTSSDIIGVEVGGAVKNVLAIGAGIADGLGFGANTRAALITRGLTEMMRLGVALGGQRDTFMGLAGLGDLVLTCTDNQSRNRRLGLALAAGKSLSRALADIGQVVEGVQSARELVNQAQHWAVDMPITQQVYRVLHENLPPKAAVDALLLREQKSEAFR